MEFRILGPVEVRDRAHPLDLGGSKPRALLAILLLHLGEVVPDERLIDELWGEAPPRSARHLLHVHVSSLRKAFQATSADARKIILRRPAGYLLEIDSDRLDARRFERLLAEGTQLLADGDPGAAAMTLRRALQLWRGPALAEYTYEPFAQGEIGRLEELRLAALEAQVDADLALGRHAELTGELEALVRRHPLRERLRAQLMLALYRSGRQADALAAYRDARRMLVEELGLEPSEELRQLERRILTRDPALAPPAVAAAPPTPTPPARTSQRRRLALGAVALLVVGGISVGTIRLAGSSDGTPALAAPNAMAIIDAKRVRVEAFAEAGTTPTNVAVGEGAVWIVNADDRTVSRIDSRTRRIVTTFGTGAVPTDLAVGAGAVWVGHGRSTPAEGFGFLYTASVSRLDVESTVVTRTADLPGGQTSVSGAFKGMSQLAVDANAVWAINPDLGISRIDAATGELVATVDLKATSGIAAGKEGVWAIGNGPFVVRVNRRTNRAGQRIGVGASFLTGIALGAGSVWAAAPQEGVLWRIHPGPTPVTRTIDVGFGAAYVAFGAGAVWTANFIDGTVSRIDPTTNKVTATVRVPGTPQGIAVGDGSVWVSLAGWTKEGALPPSACRKLASGGAEPDVLIASDLPLQGPSAVVTRPMAEAIRFVLREHGFRAGKYDVGYVSCDDSTAQRGDFEFFKCGSNAKAYAQAARLVAVIGTYNSPCAAVEIPILNQATGGPLAMVSPANTNSRLTFDRETFYPSGVRSFVRLVANDSVQGAADATLARELGLKAVYVLDDGGVYGVGVTTAFRTAARKLELGIAGSGAWDPSARSYARLADTVARSGADGVFLGGLFFLGGGEVVKALRRRLGEEATIIASDGFLPVPDVLETVGRGAHGMYVSVATVPLEELGPVGRRFVRRFTATQPGRSIPVYVTEAAQAAEVVLEAIAHSDGTRASVLREVRAIAVEDGIIGSFRFDRNGDITPHPVTILRITGQTRRRTDSYSDWRGALVERVMNVPASLTR